MAAKNYAYVNSQMLVWARNETPFSTVEQAVLHLRGITAEKLVAWEEGADYPSINEAKRLAALYRVPLACFYLSTPPEKRIKRYTDRRMLNGVAYSNTSFELWCEIGRVISSREKILEYADSDDRYSCVFPVLSPNLSIDAIADSIRNYLGLRLPFRNKSAYKSNAFSYFRSILESPWSGTPRCGGCSRSCS